MAIKWKNTVVVYVPKYLNKTLRSNFLAKASVRHSLNCLAIDQQLWLTGGICYYNFFCNKYHVRNVDR